MLKLIKKFQPGGTVNNQLIPKNNTTTNNQQSAYNTLRFDYIKQLENPDAVGFDPNSQRWTTVNKKGYDPYQIGIGLDTRTNKHVADFLRRNKRNWLSDSEMRALQNTSFNYFEGVLDRHSKGLNLSNNKRAMALGLLYRGDGTKLWNNAHPLSQAFFNGTDKDFSNAIYNYYNSINLKRRADYHNKFWQGKI